MASYFPRMTIQFFTKKQCSLCVPAKANIRTASSKVNNAIIIEEIDIEKPENKYWFDQYKWDIPVGLVNSNEIFRHRVSEEKISEVYRIWSQTKGSREGS